MEKNKVNETGKIWAKSDDPFKAYEFSKFQWMSCHGYPWVGNANQLLVGYVQICDVSADNSPFILYTKFNIFFFFQKSGQHFHFSRQYYRCWLILQVLLEELCWIFMLYLIEIHKYEKSCTKWMESCPQYRHTYVHLFSAANSRIPMTWDITETLKIRNFWLDCPI